MDTPLKGIETSRKADIVLWSCLDLPLLAHVLFGPILLVHDYVSSFPNISYSTARVLLVQSFQLRSDRLIRSVSHHIPYFSRNSTRPEAFARGFQREPRIPKNWRVKSVAAV